MKRKSGFTLIELIGVIIIMGLVLLIVFPATTRLIKGNDEKKYNQYYELIEEASHKYADSRRDDLGGIRVSGCIDITLTEDLIKEDYLKVFDDDEIECKTPSEFNLADYSDDIDTSKNYTDIRIRNDKGKISTEVSLICVKGKKVVYSNLKEKSGTCDKYIASAQNVLYDKAAILATTSDDGKNYYVSTASTNNYVLYSGKMWRIVETNKEDKTIKLVSNEIVTTLPYNVSTSNFYDSNVDIWLNETFLKTLRNPSQYLLDANWNYTTVSNAAVPGNTNVLVSKVGLLNYYEFDKAKAFLTTTQPWWLMSKASEQNVWYVNANSNTPANASINTFLGVRPSIVLKANVTYVSGGDGTVSNPYKLEGDNVASPGVSLNSRYAGEYVTFAGEKYRIIEVSANYTRLIKESFAGNSVFDSVSVTTYNSGTTIGLSLNDTWYNSLPTADKDKLVSADFCTSIFTTSTKYSVSCRLEDVTSAIVGLPKIGDLYTTPSVAGEYWTISNNTVDTINTLAQNGTVLGKTIRETSGVRPVINLSSTVKISGGSGTTDNPYILQ